MAKHKSLKSLGNTILKISTDVEKNIVNGLRKAALVIDRVAVVKTPVDTGYARSRWTASIGEPVAADPAVEKSIKIDKGQATSIALSQARSEIRQWDAKGSLFITNPVHYVVYLDGGTSQQEPLGITEEAVNAGQEVLKQLKVLKR